MTSMAPEKKAGTARSLRRVKVDNRRKVLLRRIARQLAREGSDGGNWTFAQFADAGNTIPEPSTEFACARKLAYRNSQVGRNALPMGAYAHVFEGKPIGAPLIAELQRRRAAKQASGHMDMAP